MKATINKSELMKEAHRLYKFNKSLGWSFGKSLSLAWSNAKARVRNAEIEAKNDAIRAMWQAEADAKRKAEIQAENAKIVASGMDLHTYSMTNYYANNTLNLD